MPVMTPRKAISSPIWYKINGWTLPAKEINIALRKQVRLASIGKRSAGREDPEPHPPSAIGEAKPMPEPSQADENFSLSCSKWQIHAHHDSKKSKK